MRKTFIALMITTVAVALCTVACPNPAQSDPTTYTVSFDSQSATTAANPATKTVTYPATTVDALPTAPAKTGYTFGGWWTATDGGGTEFTAGTTLSASLTVYARWTVSISFNANGGSGTTATIVLDADDSAVTLRTLTNSFTYTGKAFYGWSTSSDGPIVPVGDTHGPAEGSLTLFARWHDSAFQNLAWSDLRSSDDMKHLVAVVSGVTSAGGIYVSNDYGLAWIKKISRADTLGAAQGGNLIDCDVSADGRYMMAVSNTEFELHLGAIWFSSDYGANWTNIGTGFSAARLEGCALSDDGTKRVVSVPDDKVYEWTGTAWAEVSGSPTLVVDIDYAGDGSVFAVGQYNGDTYAFPRPSGTAYTLGTWTNSGSIWQGRELLVSKNGGMVLFAPKPGAYNATLWSLGVAQTVPLATIADSSSSLEANGTDATWNADGSFKTGYLAAAGRGILKFAIPASPTGTITPTSVNGTGATSLEDKLTGWMWNGIAVSPDEQTLVALAAYVDGTNPGGMYLSTDGGATWTRVY